MCRIAVIILSICGLFGNCGIVDNSGTSDDGMEPIEDTILFHFAESYKASEEKEIPKIKLYLQSANVNKIYPCSNYRIETDLNIEDQNIKVELKGISLPTNCLTGPSLASSEQFIEIAPGIYNLKFKYKSQNDHHILTISDSSIQVESVSQNITLLKGEPFYFRYPTNSFAFVCRRKIDDPTYGDSYLDSLKTTIKIKEFTFPNIGNHPFPKSFNDENFQTVVRYFYYEKDDDFDIAGKILEEYSKANNENGTGYKIELQSWDNRKYYSWLM